MGYFVIMLTSLTLLHCCEAGSRPRSELWNKGAADVDCFDIFTKCKEVPECKALLRSLNRKCMVVGGRCANETYLQECGEKYDQLLSDYGFPKKRCKCVHVRVHKLTRCFDLLNKVYANPCIEKAQKMANARKLQAASEAQALNSGLHNETSVSTAVTEQFTSTQSQTDETPTKPEEPIFGDEGFAEPPSSRKQPPSRNWRRSQSHRQTQRRKIDEEPDIIATTAVFDDEVSTKKKDITTVLEVDRLDLLRKKLDEEASEITKDMKLRIASIVIGSIFILAILMGGVYLGFKRIRKTQLMYKKGNPVQQNCDSVS